MKGNGGRGTKVERESREENKERESGRAQQEENVCDPN